MKDSRRIEPRAPSAASEGPKNAREMLELGREFLERRGIEEWRLDAELLVAQALELDRLHLFLELDRPVSRDEVTRARELLVRRGKGEPTAYLIGKREFYGRDFRVGPGVLVPRPETELLVDVTREALADKESPRIAELGAGSGCISITLALELEGARLHAVEVSEDALTFARPNAEALGASVEFVSGDGLQVLADAAPFDWIVSNPPYIDPNDRGELGPEVADHEPVEALFAPEGDPDHWVRRLLAEGAPLLAPGGGWAIELGHDQGARALALAQDAGHSAELRKDLAGIERVLLVRRADG